ncbi:MAG: hypothetical protein CM15mP103_11260 [Gammaproteobacteria bacterium]|nr:MAG: hypothetical protein CM15mP103_11260 [Gammaproteobacteria bacterium]
MHKAEDAVWSNQVGDFGLSYCNKGWTRVLATAGKQRDPELGQRGHWGTHRNARL